MLDQVNAILSQAAQRVTKGTAEFLPGLLALAVILLLTAAISWIGRAMIRRSLQRINFDKVVQQWGLSGIAEWSPSHSPSLLIAGIAYWFFMLIGVLMGLSALDTSLTSAFVMRLVGYLPNIFAAAFLLLAGIVLARFAARGVLISAVNLHIQWARLLSLGVKWLVVVLAAAMALEHLGIGGQIVSLAFGILFGGIVLALALAVGLGSKDMVSRSLERTADKRAEDEEQAGKFQHF